MEYIEVSGSNYEMGFQIGKKFKNYLSNVLSEYDFKVSKVFKTIKYLEQKMKVVFPNCLDEIYGRADGANVSRDSMLLLFFPEVFNKIDGCTTAIVKKTNSVLFAHNEDEKNCTKENIALIKYNYKDRFVVSLTRADKLAGNAFSFNSDGLIISSNQICDEGLNLNNLSRYIVSREVINSRSIAEIVDLLQKIDVASAFSLNVLDINSNEIINIEKDLHEIYLTKIEARYVRSNHFHAKQHDESKEPKSSKFRYSKANELIKKINLESCSLNDVREILNYKTDDYYKTIFKDYDKYHSSKSLTVATFCTDTSKNEIIIYDYIYKCIIVLNREGNIVSQNKLV